MDCFSQCDNAIKEKLYRYAPDLKIGVCRHRILLNGKLEMEEPNFNPDNGMIYLDEREDNDEYAETFKHEFGHYVDDRMGCPSCEKAFTYALKTDFDFFTAQNTGINELGKMLGELSTSLVMENRYISDILSGMFYNCERHRTAVTVTYEKLGLPIYGHEDAYWMGKKGPKNAVQLEIFADLFAIYAENDIDTVQFMEKWFPHISRCFKEELDGGTGRYG